MIYFAQDETTFFIKIGFTDRDDAEARIRSLQTGNPSSLVLLFTMPGSQAEERAIHQRFATHRVRGEWFRPCREVLAFLAENWWNNVERPLRHIEMNFITARYKLTVPQAKFMWFLIQELNAHGPLAFSIQAPNGDSIDRIIRVKAKMLVSLEGNDSLEKIYDSIEEYADSILKFSESDLEEIGNSLDHRFDGIGDWYA
jgi:Meiotically up-regulated gene 113